MSTISRRPITMILAIAVFSLIDLNARPSKHSVNEEGALNLLLSTLTRDHVYDKRISLDCVTFETENITRIYFEFALREKHSGKCGGDPDTNPVIDRYRVSRASGRIEFYVAANENWQPYNPKQIK